MTELQKINKIINILWAIFKTDNGGATDEATWEKMIGMEAEMEKIADGNERLIRLCRAFFFEFTAYSEAVHNENGGRYERSKEAV